MSSHRIRRREAEGGGERQLVELFGREHRDEREMISFGAAPARSVRIFEYDATGNAVARELDSLEPAVVDWSPEPDGDAPAHFESGSERQRLSDVDHALDDALVHAPVRQGASYPEVVRRICERVEVDEETAWAILGRALARSEKPAAD